MKKITREEVVGVRCIKKVSSELQGSDLIKILEKEEIAMSFEKFERQQRPDWPAVTIRKNGSLSPNRRAIDEFNIGQAKFVTLHFDAKAGQIGIKPVEDDKDPSTFKISKEKGKSFVIGCQAFLKAAKIPYWQGSRILKAEWDAERKMIIMITG